MVIVVLPGCLPRALGVLPHESVNKMGKKGKMPPALRAYWAAKRGVKRSVSHMARRSGRKGRSGRTRIPILPAMAGAALGLGVAMNPRGGPNDNPVYYATHGDYSRAGQCTMHNLVQPKTYLVPVGILLADGVLRMLLGRVPIGKRASLL